VIPQAIEAEQSVLGAMMMAPESIDRIYEILDEDDFYRPDHRLIWRAITQLGSKGLPVDPITLGEWLKANDWDGLIGDSTYLVEICNNTTSASNIQSYAAIVREKSLLRQLMSMAEDISNACQIHHCDAREAIAEVIACTEKKLHDIAIVSYRGKSEIVPMRDAIKDAFRNLMTRHEDRRKLLGTPTGLNALDEAIDGLCPSELTVLAARDGMGKTSLAMNICEHIASRKDQTILVFSLKKDASELASRMLSSTAGINRGHISRGDMPDSDWPKLSNAISLLQEASILIDESNNLSATILKSRARQIHRERGLGLIIIDDLQGMYPDEHQAEKLRSLCRELKALAKELQVPVLALSQLGHAIDLRPDKRPMMSDLSAYGGLDTHADQVLFLYRDEFYNRHSTDKGIAEVIIGKQQHGPTGIVRLRFLEHCQRFENEDTGRITPETEEHQSPP